MTHTFLSAAFSDPGHTCAVAQTAEAAAVAVSERDTPEMWAAMLAAVHPAPFSASQVPAS